MFLSDFDFELPEELIATRPASPRSSARLLVAKGNNINDSFMEDLPRFLRSGDRLVLNDTKVLPARLNGVRNRSFDGNKISSANIDYSKLGTGRRKISLKIAGVKIERGFTSTSGLSAFPFIL